MAHFAKVENGVVTQVIVISNSDCGNVDFPASEEYGQNFIKQIGLAGMWFQTSYNNNFRGKFAGIGDLYLNDLDIFVPPKPFPSWKLDENNLWQPPIERPGNNYAWNEEKMQWEPVPNYNLKD